MYCSNCGKESNKKVCASCGVKKGKSKQYCTWCGNELQENASVCTNCNEKTNKNPILAIAAFAVDVILMLMFLIHLFDNEMYRTALLYPIVILGLVLALPFMRSVISKKTHTNRKMRMPAHIVRYALVFVLFMVLNIAIIPMGEYNTAVKTAQEDPVQAMQMFKAMGDYKDAPEQAAAMEDAIFNNAKSALENNNWQEAEELIKNIPDYKKLDEIKPELSYQKGVAALKNYRYDIAKRCFKEIGNYKDVSKLKKNVGIGLSGNEYNYTATSYGPTRVSSYSWFFNDASHNTESSATARKLVLHTPKLYAGGMDLDSDATYQYRIIDNRLCISSPKIEAPEKIEDWISSDKMTDIIWSGDEITSFTISGLKYTIQK